MLWLYREPFLAGRLGSGAVSSDFAILGITSDL